MYFCFLALPCTIEVVGYPRLSSALAMEVEVETSKYHAIEFTDFLHLRNRNSNTTILAGALVPEKQHTDAWTMPDEPGKVPTIV